MRVLHLMLCGLVFSACSGKLPAPSDPAGCLAASPPAAVPVHVSGPEEGCPGGFAVCLSPAEALKVVHQIEDLRRWAAEAFARCSAPPAAKAKSPSGG